MIFLVETRKMVNVCVVGPSKVGKSAIVLRLTYDIFPTEHDPTIEDWYTRTFRGNHFQFRDTSGLMSQPEKGLRQSSLKDSHIVLLVYDASDPQSIEDLSPFAQEIPEGPLVLVVANKCDRLDGPRCPTVDRGNLFARENGWGHICASAKMNYHMTRLLYMICAVKEEGEHEVLPVKQRHNCCQIL